MVSSIGGCLMGYEGRVLPMPVNGDAIAVARDAIRGGGGLLPEGRCLFELFQGPGVRGWVIAFGENPVERWRSLGGVWKVFLDGVFREWFFCREQAEEYVHCGGEVF